MSALSDTSPPSPGNCGSTDAAVNGVGGVYIEYTRRQDGGDGCSVVLRVPTTHPLPTDINPRDDLTAVLVFTHKYFETNNIGLCDISIDNGWRLRYCGGGKELEPGLEYRTTHYRLSNLKSIEFCGVENVRHIPDNFMMGLESLSVFDLSPFKGVTSVGRGFMRDYGTITSIDLTPLRNITSIPDYFITACTALTSIDLSPLCCCNIITEVGMNFMSDCSSLTSIINLEPLRNVVVIRHRFLEGCTSLTTIDLTPLSNVVTIEGGFMNRCQSLRHIDLTPMGNVTEVGDFFLGSCLCITSIDLTAFANVTKIGTAFMIFCKSLTTVDLSPLFSNLSLDDTFMKGCKALTSSKREKMMKALEELKVNNNGNNGNNNHAIANNKNGTSGGSNGIIPSSVMDARKANVKVGGKRKKNEKNHGEVGNTAAERRSS